MANSPIPSISVLRQQLRWPFPAAKLFVVPIGLAIGAAMMGGLILPQAAFRARALVSVEDAGAALPVGLVQDAAQAAVSESIIRGAAQSLLGTQAPMHLPTRLEQAGSYFGFFGNIGAGGRLMAQLKRGATATPDEVLGTLEIAARSADPEEAVRYANALATSLVADQQKRSLLARKSRETDGLARLRQAQDLALMAHRRLDGLAGEPGQIRTDAVAQTADAQARLDAVRAIIASGTPPLSDRHDLPSAAAALQSSYLNLTQELATVRATLGEKHVTVISLRNAVKNAAASLTAEWARLERLAESEVERARRREALLRQTDIAADSIHRDSIEAARRAVESADAKLARAQQALRQPSGEERVYRLLSRAERPTMTVGLSAPIRMLAAGLLGLAAFGLGFMFMRRRVDLARPTAAVNTPIETPFADAPMARASVNKSVPETGAARVTAADKPDLLATRPDTSAVEVPPAETVRADLWADDILGAQDAVADDGDGPVQGQQAEDLPVEDILDPQTSSEELPLAWDPAAEAPANEDVGVATIMVAANDSLERTTPVALRIGRAAAREGYRVLVLETSPVRPALAAAVDPDADPVVIDVVGELRVALRSDCSSGDLYLAPSFNRGAEIAALLASAGDALVFGALAVEFDLLVIDGGCASGKGTTVWAANAYVRVGSSASWQDDARFVKTFGVLDSAPFMTVVSAVPDTRVEVPPPAAARSPRIVPTPQTPAFNGPRRRRPSRPIQRFMGLRRHA